MRNSPIVIALALLLATGCGSKSTNMRVWGEVSYDGQPIELGQILLNPIDSTSGPSTGGAIEQGKYDLPSTKGPRAGGTYRVEITALGSNETTYVPNASGQGLPTTVREQFIPPEYNRQSTLRITVSPNETENQRDFALTR